jgi:hypothetical protein
MFTDDEPLPLSFWLLGRSPRRAILPTFAIWGVIAPAVNLWGSGSFLASLAPESARSARLDTFYPVGQRGYPYSKGFLQLDYNVGKGFKRYIDDAGRFEFRYPSEYVQVRPGCDADGKAGERTCAGYVMCIIVEAGKGGVVESLERCPLAAQPHPVAAPPQDAAVYLRKSDAGYTQRMMDPTLAATPSAPPPRLTPPIEQAETVAVEPSDVETRMATTTRAHRDGDVGWRMATTTRAHRDGDVETRMATTTRVQRSPC